MTARQPYFSRMMFVAGARANVPNPEPHKQMPIARDLTMMFKYFLSFVKKGPVFREIGDTGHDGGDVHEPEAETGDDGVAEDEQGDGVDKTGRQEPECRHHRPAHADHVTPVTGGQLTRCRSHKSVHSYLKNILLSSPCPTPEPTFNNPKLWIDLKSF